MSEASIRELRNRGGDVVERAEKGEKIVITRSGKPVAELGPLSGEPTPLTVLLDRWRTMPDVDVQRFRDDLDGLIDPAL